MKDLYARIGMKPHEVSEEQLRTITGHTTDVEAARYVLLHAGRREIYDRTHATLTDIGIARAALGLNDSPNWRPMADFRYRPPAQDRPASDRSLRRAWAIVGVGLLAALALPIIAYVTDDGSPRPRAQAQPAQQTRPRTSPWHVTAEVLNVRSEPSTLGQPLGKLHKFDTVDVRGLAAGREWAEITYEGKTAYVATAYLAAGDGRAAHNAACRAGGIVRPRSGQILESSGRRGEHELTINASASSDAIAKLETPDGATVLQVYVRAGESAYLTGIPDGRFRFKFATGQDYSPSCGRFVENMQAFMDDQLEVFEKRNVPGGYYVTQLEYTLYDVVAGNFHPTPVAADEF